MVAEGKDRHEKLMESDSRNGIDFIKVGADQITLEVHFLNTVPLINTITRVEIEGGEAIRAIALQPINDEQDWSTDADNRPVLTLHVNTPGDFSLYTLKLTSTVLDPFFSQIPFSFKANCPSDLDCAASPLLCPPVDEDIPPIDYLAKDFLSFRKALSDFSALRYPNWRERSEADFGVMFMEALCAVADDLSYYQDRVAAEASLDTATQRRSIVRHARLVDYEPRPATTARTLLQCDVAEGITALPTGLIMTAQGLSGAIISFETGTGLIDPISGSLKQESPFPVNSRWNRHHRTQPYEGIKPYYWDESQGCLKAGATELWVENVDNQSFEFPDENFLLQHDFYLLIETNVHPGEQPIRELVRLIKAELGNDPLYGVNLTHLFWRSDDALKYDHDLTKTILVGNLVPAIQGRRYTETFAIPSSEDPSAMLSAIGLAIARTGPNSTPDAPVPQYLYTLSNSPLSWIEHPDSELPLPEIVMEQVGSSKQWQWRKTLLDAKPFEETYSFTVDPVRFSRIARNSDGTPQQDYDGDTGDTIRFGDGIFGELPESGDIFRVTYRVADGVSGNVAADSITGISPAGLQFITAVTNPFPATGGADREPNERVQRMAPQAFQTRQFRAVRPEDYQAAAETLLWVQRSGTTFRWTGSWISAFTTADSLGREDLTVEQQLELINLLDRYRLAGRESYVLSPRYVSLDLDIQVCAQPNVFRGDVKRDLLKVLSAARFPDGSTGFFYVDRWSFGQSLERSTLEAVIQSVPGVAGVLSIDYRRRGLTSSYQTLPDAVPIPRDAILRVDNDPSTPERGSLRIRVEGGK